MCSIVRYIANIANIANKHKAICPNCRLISRNLFYIGVGREHEKRNSNVVRISVSVQVAERSCS